MCNFDIRGMSCYIYFIRNMCDFDIRGISCYIYFIRNMSNFDIRGDVMLYIFYKKHV